VGNSDGHILDGCLGVLSAYIWARDLDFMIMIPTYMDYMDCRWKCMLDAVSVVVVAKFTETTKQSTGNSSEGRDWDKVRLSLTARQTQTASSWESDDAVSKFCHR